MTYLLKCAFFLYSEGILSSINRTSDGLNTITAAGIKRLTTQVCEYANEEFKSGS